MPKTYMHQGLCRQFTKHLRVVSLKIHLYKLPVSIVLLFALIFALLSFPNHYLLRTYALDLGMFNHALYDFS
ncbi:MAG: hypothetical protein ACT6QS_10050, partial [Flavobacteriales bacterium]